MKASGKKINKMVKERSHGQIERSMKVITSKVRNAAKVSSSGLTAVCIKVTLRITH